MLTLSPLQRVALASAVTGKVLSQARETIAEGSQQSVDVTVRVFGTVDRGVGTPSGSAECPASVHLTGPAMTLALLRELGIGPKRLAAALESLTAAALADGHESIGDHCVEAPVQLAATYEAAKAAAVEQLPKATRTTSGRAGSITTSLDVEVVA